MRFRRNHRRLRAIYLVHDSGASHISHTTRDYFARCRGWWQPRLTPALASWLDQAELLNHAFDRRYLKRGSWKSRTAYIVSARDNQVSAGPGQGHLGNANGPEVPPAS